MKRIVKKFLIVCICLFCIICQLLNYNVYAYTVDEIREMSDFKTVEKDGVPDSYDVLINAKSLINNERLPSGIKTSVEDVLYNDSGLLSIDFFGKAKKQPDSVSKKEKKAAKTIRSFVRNAYRVFLYIGLASMLVVLIYMGVVVVTSGISPTINILPFASLINGKRGETPKQNRKSKEFVEQWFKSVVTLALAVFVMNLTVAFSNNIIDDIKGRTNDNQLITVYVKNSKFATNALIIGGSGSSTSVANIISSTSGNSDELRKLVIDQAKSLENLGAQGGQCEKWVELVYRTALNRPDIPYQCCAHKAGQSAVNSSSTTDNIIPGAAVFSYRSSSGTTDSACGQDAGHVGIYIGDGKIASCTGRGDTGIVINTIEEWKEIWDFSCWGWLPGTEDLADGATGDNLSTTSSSSSGSGQTRIVDYYFKTNMEGLLMFQSQFSSQNYVLKGTLSLIGGKLLCAFKIGVYFILVLRTILVAAISIVAPILILINSFIKISGGKGILKNWIKIYLYLVLLQPVVALIYYVMMQSNVYLVSEFPLYAGIVGILITILFIKSLKRLIGSIRAK